MLPFSTSARTNRGAVITLASLFLLIGFFLIISKVRASDGSLANWRFDFSAPTVAITSPEGGSAAEGTLSVKVTARDNTAISLVKLYKDGHLFGQDALPPYEFLWSTALEANNTYSLKALAIDVYGNTSTSQPVRVAVSNPAAGDRPSIVVVVTDDQRWDTMQYMPVTNSLLYAESIRFTNAIAAVPLCCPSRSSIFTGLYSHNHGIVDNFAPYGGAQVFRDSGRDTSTIATWLNEAGYRTGLFGKYLNSYDKISPYIPPGWDRFSAFLNDNGNYYNYTLVENGTPVAYGDQPAEYATSVIAGEAVQFIYETNPADPVLVYFAPFAPHSTHAQVDSPPTPGPGDSGMYASLPPWRPASYNEAEVSDKPRWIRELPSLTPARRETGDLFRIRQIESLQAVDRAVGELIEALIQTGRYENTIFVFLSDNGLSWGEHRWNMKKWCAYEECIRIPLWVRVPGIAGRDDGALVNDVDLGPTLAEFAGALPLGELDGLSLVDLIENPQAPWRTEAYTEFLSPAIKGDQMIFCEVRTATATYMEYENGDREFYDLTVDPLQEHNRVDDPEYADKVRDLQKALKILEED